MRVILVFFDTMRYDHASFNGYGKPTTPNLDRLAAEGAVFAGAYCTDVPTQPCYTSVFTGKRGITTGVVTHGQAEETLADGITTFPMLLARRGLTTAAVSSLYRFRRWFARGFVHWIEPNMDKWLQHVTADDVNSKVIPWLRAYGKEPFFLFLHYWDPHTPYNKELSEYVDEFYEGGDPADPGNDSLEPLRRQPLMYFFRRRQYEELHPNLTDLDYVLAHYDAEIRYADDRFGQVLDVLDELGVLEETMIIFTSDHGEDFGEHAVFSDHMDAYEATAHTPLMVWWPERVQARRIDALVQHIDLAPTILEAFGAPVPEDYEGQSLWPLLEGETDEQYEYVFTNQGLWSAQRAMRSRRWALVKTINWGMLQPREPTELFDRERDPYEQHNVADEHPDVLDEMELKYWRWLEERLGNRPDPLRIAGQENAATRSVQRRYERWVLEQRAAAAEFSAEDRAAVDHRPGE